MTRLIDIRDKKLIYYLSLNARTSYSALAKQLNLSKNAVKYRAERLRRLGIIQKYACVVNIGAIKAETFDMMLRFNEDIYATEDILGFFKKNDAVTWLVTLSGEWDMLVEFVFKDILHFKSIISGTLSHFGQRLDSYKVFLPRDILRVEHLISDFYQELNMKSIPRDHRTQEKYDLDKVDREILSVLNEDSTLRLLDIAKKLDLTIDIVRYRIRKLSENKIIIKFFPEISLQKLGYTEYLFVIKLRNASDGRIEELKNYIRENDNVTYAFLDSLTYSIICVCAFKTMQQMDEFSRPMRRLFGEVIELLQYSIISGQVLFNLFPKTLLLNKDEDSTKPAELGKS